MWYLFALLSACFSAVRKAGEKQLSHQLNYVTMGWAIQLLSLPVLLLALLVQGEFLNPLSLGASFWLPTVIAGAVLWPLFLSLYIQALKHGELSKVLPLQGLTPIFALLFGRILINQVPAPQAVVGILLVVVGIYVLNLRGKYLHNPFKIFSRDKANLYMLLSLILAALIGALDKTAIRTSEPILYSCVSTVVTTATLLVISRAKHINEFDQVKKSIRLLTISGLLSGLSYGLYMVALNTGPLAYISTIKSTTVVMGTIIGVLVFKERLTNVKVAALLLITIGTVAIGLSQ